MDAIWILALELRVRRITLPIMTALEVWSVRASLSRGEIERRYTRGYIGRRVSMGQMGLVWWTHWVDHKQLIQWVHVPNGWLIGEWTFETAVLEGDTLAGITFELVGSTALRVSMIKREIRDVVKEGVSSADLSKSLPWDGWEWIFRGNWREIRRNCRDNLACNHTTRWVGHIGPRHTCGVQRGTQTYLKWCSIQVRWLMGYTVWVPKGPTETLEIVISCQKMQGKKIWIKYWKKRPDEQIWSKIFK